MIGRILFDIFFTALSSLSLQLDKLNAKTVCGNVVKLYVRLSQRLVLWLASCNESRQKDVKSSQKLANHKLCLSDGGTTRSTVKESALNSPDQTEYLAKLIKDL